MGSEARFITRDHGAPGQRSWLLPNDPALAARVGVTPRELEVLAQVAVGDTNEAIAEALGISRRTVDKHLQRAFKKLGVRTRTAAVVRALERSGGSRER